MLADWLQEMQMPLAMPAGRQYTRETAHLDTQTLTLLGKQGSSNGLTHRAAYGRSWERALCMGAHLRSFL